MIYVFKWTDSLWSQSFTVLVELLLLDTWQTAVEGIYMPLVFRGWMEFRHSPWIWACRQALQVQTSHLIFLLAVGILWFNCLYPETGSSCTLPRISPTVWTCWVTVSLCMPEEVKPTASHPDFAQDSKTPVLRVKNNDHLRLQNIPNAMPLTLPLGDYQCSGRYSVPQTSAHLPTESTGENSQNARIEQLLPFCKLPALCVMQPPDSSQQKTDPIADDSFARQPRHW